VVQATEKGWANFVPSFMCARFSDCRGFDEYLELPIPATYEDIVNTVRWAGLVSSVISFFHLGEELRPGCLLPVGVCAGSDCIAVISRDSFPDKSFPKVNRPFPSATSRYVGYFAGERFNQPIGIFSAGAIPPGPDPDARYVPGENWEDEDYFPPLGAELRTRYTNYLAYVDDVLGVRHPDGFDLSVLPQRPWADPSEVRIWPRFPSEESVAVSPSVVNQEAQADANVGEVELNEDEREVIGRLMETGESQSTVIRAFVACGRDEPTAMASLLGIRF
jgi:hypothetical protein